MKHKAVFFDRDGVLNVDKAYLYKIDELEWIDGALEAIAYLTQSGYLVFVVTNQSGIARGYYTVAEMEKLHQHMTETAAVSGGKIEKFYYCPHLPAGSVVEYAVDCECRKPKPGLILQALAEYDIDTDRSFLVGDKKRDVEAAEAAGIKGFLFEKGNLLDFIKTIIS
ncbi:D-glycero-beta-D-manno-heptose 1,7-bisphosphate 7-phosphatase [uncultured Phascolarctobacterium sp.]|jgi:D-glycero-D-manno-heptose 1,7-bisphosphate phosphatase|uniref:D-glycero-beta-D-manno-heptose 1,7-bisphosphate 7-phosphatase n=1 Tax=uncultured Phascolarctobacterium sp. TaxID=512296 RepID=UPI0015AD536C|nr:D-glycero-beta-D-manno-heptose 1,7-bisphosphate 7-phosphatase [uncultured Phascolarctobacterium sp.]